MDMTYDYIITGAGPAGCVLASRLSEDSQVRVLLLEAGGGDWNPLFHMPAGFAKMTKGVASWGWENYSSAQRSRNASDAAQQADPQRDWTTDYTGKVKFFEGSVDINAIEKTRIRISGDWNKSNDTYLYGLVTGSPLAVPEQLPPVKSELLRSEVDVSYELTRNLRLGAAYWFDDYHVEDFALGPDTITGIALPEPNPGQPLTPTNALLLGYLYRPYTAHVGFVRLTYLW